MRIQKLLIANRGEIARRIIRTCRSMGIATVAVYSDPDAAARFVLEADEAVPLGGATPADSYLRAEAVLAAVQRTGADAVHPGYGFLSENGAFAAAVVAAGARWVGPPPSAIEAMGAKVPARNLMIAAGVPVLPGADLTQLAESDYLGAADEVGWPVLVKASYGGGGRGMRIVRTPAELLEAVASARREAGSAFGNDAVFLERYVEAPRHIEIQVMADTHGNVVSLFERECSIQRRHQKIIEEAPSAFVTPAMRSAMGEAAVTAARTIRYEGAGTVEFIANARGEFFFLEMNTRLQVEHPVTEMVTGLDLVRAQLLVAQGDMLPPEYLTPSITGHAIEARLYAEDPDNGYLPAPGPLHRLRIAGADGVRIDSGFVDGDVVSANYDPMLAKVISWAPTRAEAAQKLASCLARTQVHGVITNRQLLVGILCDGDFLDAAIDTHYLDRKPPASFTAGRASSVEIAHSALAAALAQSAAERRDAPVQAGIPSGYRNNPSSLHTREYEADARGGAADRLTVGYRLGRTSRFEVNGAPIDASLVSCEPAAVVLVVDGVRRLFSVHTVGDSVYVDTARGGVTLRALSPFPAAEADKPAGSLVAPMPGTVTRVEVAVGAAVSEGQVLAALEAMKMEHVLRAPYDGVVAEVRVAVKQAVDAGDVLIVVEEHADG